MPGHEDQEGGRGSLEGQVFSGPNLLGAWFPHRGVGDLMLKGDHRYECMLGLGAVLLGDVQVGV